MANENRISIVIKADGTAAIEAFDKIEGGSKKLTEAVEKDTAGFTEKIKKHWLSITATITAAYFGARKAWNLAEQAAQYDQSLQAFNAMASSMGASAEATFNRIKELSGGMIDDQALIESANRAMKLGIPVERLGDLMQIARASARDMGISANQAFGDIATGIGRASPMILDNLGLMLKMGEANDAYARSIGKTVEQLSSQEQKMAILNAVLDAGKSSLERHNLEVLTTKESMEKLQATVKNLELHMGTILIRAVAGAAGTFQWLASGALTAAGGVFKIVQSLIELDEYVGLTKKGEAATWAFEAQAAFDAAAGLMEKSVANFQAMIAPATQLATAIKTAIKTAESAIAEDPKTQKKRLDDLSQIMDAYRDREILLNAEQGKQELLQLEMQHRDELKKMDELKASKAQMNEAIRIQQAEVEKLQADQRRKRDLEGYFSSKEIALARADNAVKAVETEMAAERQLDQYRIAAGKLSREEAVKRQYEGERRILAVKEEQLYVQIDAAKSTAEEDRLMADLERLQKEIARSKEFEAYELDAVKLDNQRQMLQMRQQERDLQQQQREEYWAWMMETANLVGGEAGKGMGLMAAGQKGMMDLFANEDQYSQQLERAQEHFWQLQELNRMGILSETELQAEKNRLMEYEDEISSQRRLSFFSNGFKAMSGMMLSFYALSGQKHKEFFIAYKAFAIAETIINTYAAAVAAYKAMAVIPIVGPALAVAAAASAIAFGLARVAAIAAMQPGGGAATAGVPGGGGYAYAQPTAPSWQKEESRPMAVNIHIYADVVDQAALDDFARKITPSLKKAWDNRAH